VGERTHNPLKISRLHGSLGVKPHKSWLDS
jgi:hypothetical protein